MTRLCSVDGCGRRHYARSYCEAHYARDRMGASMEKLLASARGERMKFVESALASQTDDCVEWPYYRRNGGYPSTLIYGKQRDVHRYICEQVYGAQDSRTIVAGHSCHNKNCLNPRHISWITQSENITQSYNMRKISA